MPASRSVVPLLLTLLLTAGTAGAQDFDLVGDCDPIEVQDTDPDAYDAPWPARHPTAVYATLEPLANRGAWGDAGAALAESFRLSSTVPPGPARRALQANLAAAAAELRAVANDPERVARARGVDLDRFMIDTDRFVLFPNTPEGVALEDLAPEARRDLCWRAIAAQRLLVRYGAPGRQRAVNALGSMLRLWENYAAHSYSQYPWELWVNGLVAGGGRARTLGDLAPPRTQLVLLHPGIALEAAGFADGFDALRRLDVLTIEPVGVLRYNASRTSYVGASLLVTLAADEAPGLGGLVHLGERVQAGFVYRDGGRGSGVVLSVDVFGLITGVPAVIERHVAALPARVLALADRPE